MNIGGIGLFIREATEKDAECILYIRKSIISQNEFFLVTSEEFHVDIEMQKQRTITNSQQGGVTFVAEDGERIVGFLVFTRNSMKRLNHTGSFGIGILDNYRNQGAGTKMLLQLIDWAKTQDGIEKICLGVISTNERAIKVYGKIGFKEEGREKQQIKFENGQYADNIIMALHLQ
ncbi:GNAT family N-acetyltransferase [Bacillus sp. AFS018417]|uniref:GNAT family N-acetyltransferase n=1 Tax=Bacillus sp. AFS018417 TaxID=2033491 RepID=UPI0020D244A4|nr:GNAT family protein [Bacillus sp. AFS018417]